jgi:hypothetical protein
LVSPSWRTRWLPVTNSKHPQVEGWRCALTFRLWSRIADWTVTTCGRICYKRKKINLSLAFAGQAIGIKQVEDHIWLASRQAAEGRFKKVFQ